MVNKPKAFKVVGYATQPTAAGDAMLQPVREHAQDGAMTLEMLDIKTAEGVPLLSVTIQPDGGAKVVVWNHTAPALRAGTPHGRALQEFVIVPGAGA